jgi:glycosyltransferase involved in cell wall biosynthesis
LLSSKDFSNVNPSRMKNIIMVLGIGINERGWASVMSNHGRVTLIQLGMFEHVEVWENRTRVYCGPETKINHRVRRLDQALFGTMTFFRALRLILKATRAAKADVVLVGQQGSDLAAMLLRMFGRVGKIVFFFSDYLPPRGPFLIRLHRRIMNGLAQLGAKWSDEAWAISPRIHTAKVNKNNFVVPIAINHFPTQAGPREEIGYIGYPSYDHALDILFEIGKRHNLRLNIIGDSPYLQSIKHLAPPQTAFHGLLNDEVRIGEILAKCFCGYAIYRDVSPNSYSYYGFPSKSLYCFASNTPIVITNVAAFNENFEKRGVGHVVPPEPGAIEAAIMDLKKNYADYSQAIDRFRVEWSAEVEAFHQERISGLLKPEGHSKNL